MSLLGAVFYEHLSTLFHIIITTSFELLQYTEIIFLTYCSLNSLNQLETLNLGFNNFHDGLPDVVSKLQCLSELDLERCKLTDLPNR